MGTRSNIAIEQEDGSVKVAYCHYDGYVEHNGIILLNHYWGEKKAQELVDNGYASSLSSTLEEINDGRVHKDKPDTYRSLGNYMSWHVDPVYIEYIYLWRDDEWQVSRSMVYDTPDGFTKSQCYHTAFKPLHEEFWLEKKTVNS